MKKAVVTLDINNYEPAIKALTFPLMQNYADKIGADFIQITSRKYPEFPTVYEKLQCRDIGEAGAYEWVLFFDADAVISPEMFDVTDYLTKDTVCFNGKDISNIRITADKYFRRDGRYIGACNWFCAASEWCWDIWNPLDIPIEEALENLYPTIAEHNSGLFTDNHLIDDYTLSRNIARYGLKHTTLMEICGQKLGFRDQRGNGVNPYFWHQYCITAEEKLKNMLEHIAKPLNQGGLALMNAEQVMAFKAQWRVK